MTIVYVRRLTALLVLLLTCVTSFPGAGAPTAHAGTNGQQLHFYIYSTDSTSIAWLRVQGTNQNGAPTNWSRSFSPGVSNYSLSGWWWKGRTSIDWRMANGRTGGCLIDVPVSSSGDWRQVGVDRQPGNVCWFS